MKITPSCSSPWIFPRPVISVAIEPKTKADQEKLGNALSKLTQEDPTFKVHTDPDTGQTLISGMGELHLEILVDRMVREFNVAANVGRPQVAYRETILAAAEGEGKYVRQTGGRGQYGHVFLRVDPLPHPDLNAIAEITKKKSTNKFDPELNLLFLDEIVGGVVPREYIVPTYEGIREAMESGVLAGYEMNGVSVTLFDGSYHEVDSSEIAFKIAGSLGFKEAVRRAKPVLLEPVMKVEVVVPEEYMGDVLGDLSSRRGHIEGMEKRGLDPDHSLQGSAGGNVRLCHGFAFQDAGSRLVHDALPALRADAGVDFRRSHRPRARAESVGK